LDVVSDRLSRGDAGAADSWFGGGGDDSRSLSSSHNAAQDAMDRLAFHAQVKGVSEAFGALGHDAAEDVGSLAHKAAELTAQFQASQYAAKWMPVETLLTMKPTYVKVPAQSVERIKFFERADLEALTRAHVEEKETVLAENAGLRSMLGLEERASEQVQELRETEDGVNRALLLSAVEEIKRLKTRVAVLEGEAARHRVHSSGFGFLGGGGGRGGDSDQMAQKLTKELARLEEDNGRQRWMIGEKDKQIKDTQAKFAASEAYALREKLQESQEALQVAANLQAEQLQYLEDNALAKLTALDQQIGDVADDLETKIAHLAQLKTAMRSYWEKGDERLVPVMVSLAGFSRREAEEMARSRALRESKTVAGLARGPRTIRRQARGRRRGKTHRRVRAAARADTQAGRRPEKPREDRDKDPEQTTPTRAERRVRRGERVERVERGERGVDAGETAARRRRRRRRRRVRRRVRRRRRRVHRAADGGKDAALPGGPSVERELRRRDADEVDGGGDDPRERTNEPFLGRRDPALAPGGGDGDAREIVGGGRRRSRDRVFLRARVRVFLRGVHADEPGAGARRGRGPRAPRAGEARAKGAHRRGEGAAGFLGRARRRRRGGFGFRFRGVRGRGGQGEGGEGARLGSAGASGAEAAGEGGGAAGGAAEGGGGAEGRPRGVRGVRGGRQRQRQRLTTRRRRRDGRERARLRRRYRITFRFVLYDDRAVYYGFSARSPRHLDPRFHRRTAAAALDSLTWGPGETAAGARGGSSERVDGSFRPSDEGSSFASPSSGPPAFSSSGSMSP
jgi:hypothetical protein